MGAQMGNLTPALFLLFFRGRHAIQIYDKMMYRSQIDRLHMRVFPFFIKTMHVFPPPMAIADSSGQNSTVKFLQTRRCVIAAFEDDDLA